MNLRRDNVIKAMGKMGYNVIIYDQYGYITVRLKTKGGYGVGYLASFRELEEDFAVERIVYGINQKIIEDL
jgi:hypothetical protein